MVRAAETRIVGRRVIPHAELVQQIVEKHGSNGGYPTKVFDEECPPRCLHYKCIDIQAAKKAIAERRPILAGLVMSVNQMKEFKEHFQRNPKSTLFRISAGVEGEKIGHAVVIVGEQEGVWRIKNSWGDKWADGGYCKVKQSFFSEVQCEYYDVAWCEDDLRPEDRLAYADHMRRLLVDGLA